MSKTINTQEKSQIPRKKVALLWAHIKVNINRAVV